MSRRVVVVTGAPGCGKGTVINGLFREAHIVPMSSMLIELRESRVLGPIVTEMMDSGALVPTEIVNDLFTKHWRKIQDYKGDVVLDGVVRTSIQAQHVAQTVLNRFNPGMYRTFYVLEIKVPISECKIRMRGRGRSDDLDNAVIERRFRYWEAFTKQSLNTLRGLGFMHCQVDGNQSPEMVLDEARRKIGH